MDYWDQSKDIIAVVKVHVTGTTKPAFEHISGLDLDSFRAFIDLVPDYFAGAASNQLELAFR